MAESLEQIVVQYKLDITEAKKNADELISKLHEIEKAEKAAKESGKEPAAKKDDGMVKALQDARTEIGKLKTELQQVAQQSRLKDAVKQVVEYKDSVVEGAKRMAELKKQIDETTEEMHKLGQAHKGNSNQYKEMKQEVAAVQKEYDKLSESVLRASGKMESMEDAAKKMGVELNNLDDKKLEELEKEAAKVVKELERAENGTVTWTEAFKQAGVINNKTMEGLMGLPFPRFYLCIARPRYTAIQRTKNYRRY